MSIPISEERWGRLCNGIERRLHKMAEFYIGRTNKPLRRRGQHERRGTGVAGFDAMILLDKFKTIGVCEAVEAALIIEFGTYLRRANIAEDGRGGRGPGVQYLYLMWREKRRK